MTRHSTRIISPAAVFALILTLVSVSMVSAAPRTSLSSGSAPAVTHSGLLSSLTRAAIRTLHVNAPQVSIRAAARASDITDPAMLQIQWPTGATNTQGQVVDAAFADDTSKNVFEAFHGTTETYAAAGMKGGYDQAATVPLTGTDTLTAFWLGSYYASADAAAARVTQTVTHLTTGRTSPLTDVSCGTGCHAFAVSLTLSGTPYALTYITQNIGNAVGEIGFLLTVDQLSKDQSAFTGVITAVATSTLAALSGQPTTQANPPTITIAQFQLSHKVKKHLTVTHQLKSRELGHFQASVQFTNVGALTENATIVFSANGQVLGTIPMANLGTQADGTTLFKATQRFTASKLTKVSAMLGVTLGPIQAQKSINFKVAKK